MQTFNALFEHEDPHNNKYQNLWVLVQGPRTKNFAHGLSLVAENKIVETGFQNASITDLADFCVENFTDSYPFDWGKRIADYVFAIVDKRSVRDQTLRIVRWDQELQRDERGEVVDDDIFVEKWATARSTFKDASSWARILKMKGLNQYKNSPEGPLDDDDLLWEVPNAT